MNEKEPSLDQAATPTPATPTPAAPTAASGSERPHWERSAIEKWMDATLVEQRSARRWKYGLRTAWLIFLVALVWLGVDRGGAHNADITRPHTAVVEIKGEIASTSETNAELIVSSMRSAFEDEGAQAVVLLVNSPGGSPVQAGIINDEIRRLKALHKKPV